MSIHRVVGRGWQETTKWFDRIAARAVPPVRSAHVKPRMVGVRLRAAVDRYGLGPASLDYFREHVLPHFFVGAAQARTTAEFVSGIPDGRERIIASADRIYQGRFDLLGYRDLDFGDPVDWHLDPLSGRRPPLVHWSRLDPLDAAVVGDSKVIWEFNRHQWLLHLGQAYRFTRDERYAEAFARYVQGWMQANPVGFGINWQSSLEVALRLISWCWALVLFEGSRAFSAELLAAMIAAIGAHARHIERYLSYDFSPNTHLTGEALGLFYAGVLFPNLSRARQWRARGAQILMRECERQILADGVYFEQATCYQRYTAEIYLHFLILAARNGIEVPSPVTGRIQSLFDFLAAVRRPDGSMPQIGDADGGWLLPLVPRAPDDLRGVFSVAAAFFGRSDYAWVANGVTPELLWLLGSRGAKAFEALTPAPPQGAPSRVFPHGGYVVMRSGWERNAHQLVFDVGPLGCPISGGHGHADLLSVQCAVFGEPCLVDAGTYCYAADPRSRNYFRSTAAHSTVIVDGASQAVPAGAFQWRARPSAVLHRWRHTPEFDFADASHGAYRHFPGAIVHRRRIVFVRDGYWVLLDDLEGSGEHHVELRFQFAPIDVQVDRMLWARAHGRAGRGLLIRPFSTATLNASIRSGEFAPMQGWVSAVYGRRSPAPALTYAAVTSLPLRIITLLLPTVDVSAAPPAVRPVVGKDAALMGLAFADGRSVQFSDLGIRITNGGEKGGENTGERWRSRTGEIQASGLGSHN